MENVPGAHFEILFAISWMPCDRKDLSGAQLQRVALLVPQGGAPPSG